MAQSASARAQSPADANRLVNEARRLGLERANLLESVTGIGAHKAPQQITNDGASLSL